MPTESGTLTLLPNGVHEDSGFLRVTIFVSPRLLTDDGSELDLPGNFPSFEDWPQTLAECVFTIEVDGIGSAAVTIDPDALTPDSPTWHALFDKTKVGDGKFKDLSDTQFPFVPGGRRVEVHPRSLHDRVRELPERVPAGHDGTARHPRAGPREHLRGRPAPLLPDARGHGAYRRGSEGSVVAVPRPGRLPGHAGRQPGPVARVHRGAAFPRPPGCARAECSETAAPTARAAQGRLPRLRRVLRRLPELDAPARPRVRRAARATAGHERSGSYPTRGPGVAGRVDVRGGGASVDELRDRGPPVPRASRTIAKAISSTGCCGSNGSTGSRSTRSTSTAVRSRLSTSPATCSGSMRT